MLQAPLSSTQSTDAFASQHCIRRLSIARNTAATTTTAVYDAAHHTVGALMQTDFAMYPVESRMYFESLAYAEAETNNVALKHAALLLVNAGMLRPTMNTLQHALWAATCDLVAYTCLGLASPTHVSNACTAATVHHQHGCGHYVHASKGLFYTVKLGLLAYPGRDKVAFYSVLFVSLLGLLTSSLASPALYSTFGSAMRLYVLLACAACCTGALLFPSLRPFLRFSTTLAAQTRMACQIAQGYPNLVQHFESPLDVATVHQFIAAIAVAPSAKELLQCKNNALRCHLMIRIAGVMARVVADVHRDMDGSLRELFLSNRLCNESVGWSDNDRARIASASTPVSTPVTTLEQYEAQEVRRRLCMVVWQRLFIRVKDTSHEDIARLYDTWGSKACRNAIMVILPKG
jgi:hypothetical protein